MPLNQAWHEANRMPRHATLDQRIDWHAAHSAACGCRAVPASLKERVEVRLKERRTPDPTGLKRG
jgi:hypothetical protein